MKILMLGNSFIAANQMPQTLANLTGAQVSAHTRGGARLTEHLNPNTAMGEKTLAALKNEQWDYVVLQEMSKAPVTTKKKFLETVSRLCTCIRESGGTPVLLATWAYKKGSDRMAEMSMTYEEMAEGLSASYHEAADQNAALIADVGKVFFENAETQTLYAPDGRHPNEEGSLLAAKTLAEVILMDYEEKQKNADINTQTDQKNADGVTVEKKTQDKEEESGKKKKQAKAQPLAGEYLESIDTINRKDDRLRVLYLFQILKKYSDPEHPLSTKEIQQYMMEEHQIHLHRTTVPEYVDLLRAGGIPVHGERKRSFLYYLEGRTFSLSELKLLIDAIQSARFITETKTQSLTEKLMDQASDLSRDQLKRSLHTTGKAKTDNELIYRILDVINEAINSNVKISLYYYDYNIRKKKILKNEGAPYTVSCFDLIWDGDFYYLVGFCEEREEIRTFRIDRIMSVPDLLTETARRRGKGYRVEHYTQEAFRMYSTQNVEKVSLLCDSSVMKAVIDQFGVHVRTKMMDENHFQATVKVCTGPTFYRWIFGWGGKIRIEGPDNVREEYRQALTQALDNL